MAKDNYLIELSRYIHLNPVRANNNQIGELFGGTSQAIAKSYERFRKEMKGNRKLSKEIKRIERALSFVKP